MKKYDRVLWDWNGTLLDDLDMNYEVMKAMLLKTGKTEFPSKEFYLEHFSFPIINFYKLLGFGFEKRSFEDVAEEYVEEYEKRLPGTGLFTKCYSRRSHASASKNILTPSSERKMSLERERPRLQKHGCAKVKPTRSAPSLLETLFMTLKQPGQSAVTAFLLQGVTTQRKGSFPPAAAFFQTSVRC